jgi:hypothetical protein
MGVVDFHLAIERKLAAQEALCSRMDNISIAQGILADAFGQMRMQSHLDNGGIVRILRHAIDVLEGRA